VIALPSRTLGSDSVTAAANRRSSRCVLLGPGMDWAKTPTLGLGTRVNEYYYLLRPPARGWSPVTEDLLRTGSDEKRWVEVEFEVR
jgi:hypothetical protein